MARGAPRNPGGAQARSSTCQTAFKNSKTQSTTIPAATVSARSCACKGPKRKRSRASGHVSAIARIAATPKENKLEGAVGARKRGQNRRAKAPIDKDERQNRGYERTCESGQLGTWSRIAFASRASPSASANSESCCFTMASLSKVSARASRDWRDPPSSLASAF